MLSVAWSPFSLVQACRWHTPEADANTKWLRLFKVSVFHHGATHFFAVEGEGADEERARWVADIACALRILTQSLFPRFRMATSPIRGLGWTATRILAGYLLQCEERGVRLVYCELHAHWDCTAVFGAYENSQCEMRTMRIEIDQDTIVGERMAIDCSCFSLHGQHFSARTCAEKALWLRAISNVKVKLRHHAVNPTPTEISYYRAAVLESVKRVSNPQDRAKPFAPLLPIRGALSEPSFGRAGPSENSISRVTSCEQEKVSLSEEGDTHCPSLEDRKDDEVEEQNGTDPFKMTDEDEPMDQQWPPRDNTWPESTSQIMDPIVSVPEHKSADAPSLRDSKKSGFLMKAEHSARKVPQVEELSARASPSPRPRNSRTIISF